MTRLAHTRKEFASMVEARAFYLNKGYKTVDEALLSYIMRKEDGEVIINKEGFLMVVAEEVVKVNTENAI